MVDFQVRVVFVDGVVVFVDSADSPSPCFTSHVVEFGGFFHEGVWQTGIFHHAPLAV